MLHPERSGGVIGHGAGNSGDACYRRLPSKVGVVIALEDSPESLSLVDEDVAREPGDERRRLPGAVRGTVVRPVNLPGQQSAASTGMSSGPLAGAWKKVAIRMVGDPVGLNAECA